MFNKKQRAIGKIIRKKLKENPYISKTDLGKELSASFALEDYEKALDGLPDSELKLKYKKQEKILIVLAYVLAFLGVLHGFLFGRGDSMDATVRVAGALDGLIYSLAVAVMGLSMIKQFQKVSFYLVIFMSIFFFSKTLFYVIAITTLAQIVLSIVVFVMAIILYKKLFPKIKKIDIPTA